MYLSWNSYVFIFCVLHCDGVYQPCTGPAKVNKALWAQVATPPCPCWASPWWREYLKGSSPAYSGLAEEDSWCVLSAHAKAPAWICWRRRIPCVTLADHGECGRQESATLEGLQDSEPKVGSSPGKHLVIWDSEPETRNTGATGPWVEILLPLSIPTVGCDDCPRDRTRLPCSRNMEHYYAGLLTLGGKALTYWFWSLGHAALRTRVALLTFIRAMLPIPTPF